MVTKINYNKEIDRYLKRMRTEHNIHKNDLEFLEIHLLKFCDRLKRIEKRERDKNGII